MASAILFVIAGILLMCNLIDLSAICSVCALLVVVAMGQSMSHALVWIILLACIAMWRDKKHEL